MPEPNAHAISLRGVRNWILSNSFTRVQFREFYRTAYLNCLARLLQSIYIENICESASLHHDRPDIWCLRIGREVFLDVPLEETLWQSHFALSAAPEFYSERTVRVIHSSGLFLRVLRLVLVGSLDDKLFEALVKDFNNSFANMILNMALGYRLNERSEAIEPVFMGHSYYPFPALRIGPSIADVVAVSNLSPKWVTLPLLEAQGCHFHSIDYEDPSGCSADWAGISYSGNGAVLPLHPWQISLSPVVGEMLKRGAVAVLPASLKAMPLASQRTCRVIDTDHDLKLPVNATITGEHRLLYLLNSYNAPFVSALVREVHRMSGIPELDFQYDVASLCWDDASASLHLSAIIRAPCPQTEGEITLSALSLWSNFALATSLLKLSDHEEIVESFQQYCVILMRGPLLHCVEWGLAFEPHLQNVYVGIKNGRVTRIILRDLDNTIMQRGIAAISRDSGIPLAATTWSHMPDFCDGEGRLIHAMFHGHLNQVIYLLVKHTQVNVSSLEGCINNAWLEVLSSATAAGSRRALAKLQRRVGAVKNNLRMCLARSTTMTFQN